jgi:hypothetical protein
MGLGVIIKVVFIFIVIDKNYSLDSDKMIVTLAQHTSFIKVRNCNGCYRHGIKLCDTIH